MPANQYLVVLTIADSAFLCGIILLLFKVPVLLFKFKLYPFPYKG